ncbi:hypothetical protein AB0D38_45105 [Streptomyces sp. NPDC048279]|uniref:hypothetical protein n=1 Tax=Streptomyces sp. NPDC048279 TaxID=3154714 RepID=UPI003428296D
MSVTDVAPGEMPGAPEPAAAEGEPERTAAYGLGPWLSAWLAAGPDNGGEETEGK